MSAFIHEGRVVRYASWGCRTAPAVVFCHGALLDQDAFAPQVEALHDRYHVVTWDLPGHGGSAPLREWSNEAAGSVLLALMDHLNLPKATLVGLSVGAWVTQWIARHRPSRVTAMACLDATPLTDTPLPWAAAFAFRHSWQLLRWVPFHWLRWVMPIALARRAEVRRYARRASASMSRSDFLAFWRGVGRSLEPEPSYVFSQPLLVAHGAHDVVARIPMHARRWVAKTPGATLAVIPGAGHLANQDAPDATNAVLIRFLESIEDQGRQRPRTEDH